MAAHDDFRGETRMLARAVLDSLLTFVAVALLLLGTVCLMAMVVIGLSFTRTVWPPAAPAPAHLELVP